MTHLSVKEYTKRELDKTKIANLQASGHEHIYTYDEFRPWTGNNYIKSHYDVQLQDGTIVEYCYPNAGMMNAPDGRKFSGEDGGVKVRLSNSIPY